MEKIRKTIDGNLSFIPNKGGIPIYDKIGEIIRDAHRAWQEALNNKENIYPPGEYKMDQNESLNVC